MINEITFMIYMITTSLAIISLGIMCIKNVKRDLELLDLIDKIDKKYAKFIIELKNKR